MKDAKFETIDYNFLFHKFSFAKKRNPYSSKLTSLGTLKDVFPDQQI